MPLSKSTSRETSPFEPVGSRDLPELTEFLRGADLTLSGLGADGVRLWIARAPNGAIAFSTGFELSRDGEHALLRSVAVDSAHRGTGDGLEAARFALARASATGARRAWLFSRRSGGFWQKLGFEAADRQDLARVLPEAHQVRLFAASGQLEREQAWSRELGERDRPRAEH